jgi:hypothetical protein
MTGSNQTRCIMIHYTIRSCFFAILFPGFLFAQGVEGELSKNQFRIDLLSPGVAFEHAFTKDMSFVADSHAGVAFIDRPNHERDRTLGMQTLSLQYRYYLNLKKRFSKGKGTLTNSGLYTGVLCEQAIYYGQESRTLFSKAGIVSGVQYTYPNGFNVNAAGGIGYTDGITFRAKIRPILAFSLGIVLGAKRKYGQIASSH